MSCRAFEEHLARDPDAVLGNPLPEHASGCPACSALVSRLTENTILLARLARPEPDAGFLAGLAAPPADFAARRESAAVLSLLSPGVLATPEPSGELLSRLAFLPARARAQAAAAGSPVRRAQRPLLSRLFGDWRVTVALVYGVLFLVVGALRVDPLSVARDAASDLTASGERVLQNARAAAARRLESTELTRRLDYRIYRSVVAAKARATAYAQLVFEKVVGGEETVAAASKSPSGARARRPRRGTREPDRAVLRSSLRTHFERVERT